MSESSPHAPRAEIRPTECAGYSRPSVELLSSPVHCSLGGATVKHPKRGACGRNLPPFIIGTVLPRCAPMGRPPMHAAGLPAIPGFTLLDILGSGGMGIVYTARQDRL